MRALLFVALAAGAALPAPAAAQGKGGPRTPFSTADFAKLRWLEGSWKAAAADEPPLYERIHFVNDSTVELAYFRDPAFSQATGTGRLYLSVGRVYHTFGANQWVATHVADDGLVLVPQTAGRNNFTWNYVSPDAWTSLMRTGVGGRERLVRYDMTRVK